MILKSIEFCHLHGIQVKILFFLFLLLFCLFNSANASDNVSKELHTDDLIIIFNDSGKKTAKDLSEVYPFVRDELESSIGWDVDFRPVVIVLNDRNAFKKMTSSDLIIALAIPQKNLMIIDSTRVYTKPFTLRTTLKHELCHLLLHRHIENNLPRWLDEGVCQWASDGISEIMMTDTDKALTNAVISSRLIGLRQLNRFPGDEKTLLLAYQESRSVVDYIVSEFGQNKMLNILNYMKNGYSPEDAISKSLSVSYYELEIGWHNHLQKRYTRISYLSRNLPIILFTIAALITIYGFVQMLRRKKAYKDEPEDDPSS